MAKPSVLLACVLYAALGAASLAAKPRTIDNADLAYSVTVPGECRVEEGPGTLDAICAPDLDEAKSLDATTASSLVLEVDGERVPTDAAAYDEAAFKRELPEAVCGEDNAIKISISGVTVSKEGAVASYSARVSCPEIKFLGLGEREALVRTIVAPNARYRLMARALKSDGATVKDAAENFLKSFKINAERKS